MTRPAFRTLQVPLNLLDQEMAGDVLSRAARQGVVVLTRSAFLRGVLTSQIDRVLPKKLAPLRGATRKVLEFLDEDVSALATVALRFCLSFDEIATVIIGVRSIAELESDVAVLEHGPYPTDILEQLRALSVDDAQLVRPTHWD